MITSRLSWAQHLVLSAASKVDYLTFGRPRHNLPYGVFRGLVHRGLIRQHPYGWQVTDKGRERLRLEPTARETRMQGTKFRYRVARTPQGWAVLDREKPNATRDQDIVQTFTSRTLARLKAQELNHEVQRQQNREDAA